ncbi:MAG: magnesium and cobalt transport protein CorA, partial [Theionarchaea archaeon]|nr:magnesium and cobalt transport protein CorA [Theionarchaea archaeon]
MVKVGDVMFRLTRRSRKTGLPPGTLVHIGEEKTAEVRITVIHYDEDIYEEKVADIEECLSSTGVTWVNIDGVHETDIIEKVGECFNIHPLTLEDIASTEQRPKMEDYSEYVYIVLRMLSYTGEVESEQISLVCGRNFVISFQEKQGNVFDVVKERIKNGTGRMRKMGADYLAYALVDTIVDMYFSILENLGDVIEDTEESLLTDPGPETLESIQMLKREMMVLRKSVWPLREVVSQLERGESSLFGKATKVYLRDVYDHTIQVIDTIETYRDML